MADSPTPLHPFSALSLSIYVYMYIYGQYPLFGSQLCSLSLFVRPTIQVVASRYLLSQLRFVPCSKPSHYFLNLLGICCFWFWVLRFWSLLFRNWIKECLNVCLYLFVYVVLKYLFKYFCLLKFSLRWRGIILVDHVHVGLPRVQHDCSNYILLD